MDTNGLSFEESLLSVMKDLPAPIRAFVAAGRIGIVAKVLTEKYQLHIDQGAGLEKHIALLLIGIEDPETFTQHLATDAGIDAQNIDLITRDVNELIFVPLQNEMRAASQQPAPAQAPAPPKPVPPAPQYMAARPMQNMQQPAPQPTQQPAPRPVQQSIPRPTPSPLPVMRAPAPAPVNLPGAPRPERMIEDHEEPHINMPPPAQPKPQPPPEMYVRRPQPRPYVPPTPPMMPRPAVPPSMQAPPAPVPPPPPPMPRPPAPQPPQHSFMRPNPPAPRTPAPVAPQNIPPMPRTPDASRPVLKEYGIDPYREAPE